MPTVSASWLAPVAGALWAAWHLRRTYFFYDEWGMVERVLHGPAWQGMLASFNGHLWMLQYWSYRIQVRWFGIDDHVFVSAVLVAALATLHVGLAALLRAGGLSSTSSALLAGLLTYLGAASQNVVFAVQASPALSLAAGLAAAAVALNGPPSGRRAALVGALALASVGIDSGTALTTVTLVGIVTGLAWRGPARLAVLPALIVLAAWVASGSRGPVFAAGAEVRAAFAGQLLLRGAGAIVGGGLWTGAVLAALGVAAVAVAVHRGRVDARARILLVAGASVTLVVVAAVTYARAGVGVDFVDNNRYLQQVAIPLTIAAAPILAAAGRDALRAAWPAAAPRLGTGIAALSIGLAFVLGLAPMRNYVQTFDRHNAMVRDGVADAAVVIRDGCPSGLAPIPTSQPLGYVSPQVSTALLRELVARGLLSTPIPGRRPDPAVVARMCPAR